MPRGGVGSTIIFGKVQVSSDAASLKDLEKTLTSLIDRYGYPSEDYGRDKNQQPVVTPEELEEAIGEETAEEGVDEEEDGVDEEGEEDDLPVASKGDVPEHPWVEMMRKRREEEQKGG